MDFLDKEKFNEPWTKLQEESVDTALGTAAVVPNFVLQPEHSDAEFNAMNTFEWGMTAISPRGESWYLCTDKEGKCPTPEWFSAGGRYDLSSEFDQPRFEDLVNDLVHQCDGVLGKDKYGASGNDLHWVACTMVVFNDDNEEEALRDLSVLTLAQAGVGLAPATSAQKENAHAQGRRELNSLSLGDVVNFAVGTDDPGDAGSAVVIVGRDCDAEVNDWVRGRSTIWEGQLRNRGRSHYVVSGPPGDPKELLDAFAKKLDSTATVVYQQ